MTPDRAKPAGRLAAFGLALLCWGPLGRALAESAPDDVVLRNEHLAVRFAASADGPRLASIEDLATGAALRPLSSETVAMAVLPREAVHSPQVDVGYRFQEDFCFRGSTVSADGTKAVFHFDHALLSAEVAYELQADRPVLRKTVTCTAGGQGAYVAGVTAWMLKPGELKMGWPTSGAYGQPAVLFGPKGGCFLTLEWPRARVVSIDGDVRVAYRPGCDLGPGESREVAAGSIGLYGCEEGDASPHGRLEAARRAFFDHVADRVRPQVPMPVKFTTWGPWMGQMRADRVLEVMDDLADVGVDLVHLDAGWQEPDHPYSVHLPRVAGADDDTWDREMTASDRFPDGLLPIVRAARQRGMKLSLWFDACGNVFVRESDDWAVRDPQGNAVYGGMWEGRWSRAPRQSLASDYGGRLRGFVLQSLDRYDLGGVMFDNNHFAADHAADHACLANGWDSVDVQLGRILGIFDACNERRPGLYRFFCHGRSWPWALLHATHIHAGDPGMSGTMAAASATDYPARALAFERRLAWQRHYDRFVPPWGIKGDIAGWSVQQRSPVPANLDHTGLLIPSGEGWTQNMFTCFATTAVRDVRFSFRQMPEMDRRILKKWLAWDRRRGRFIFHCHPFLRPDGDPNHGLAGYSHVGDGHGVIYLFNESFDLAEAEVTLNRRLGLSPPDHDVPAYLVYPVQAPLGDGKVSFGRTVKLPVIGKDCVVIEVGLDPPTPLVAYEDYVRAARSVQRSFDTLFLTPASTLFSAVEAGPVRLEVGPSPRDRRLAAQLLETLGASAGRRMTVDGCVDVPAREAACRLVVGTREGLGEHGELGEAFRETMDSCYVAWNGKLVSAPLVASLDGKKPPAFCLVAPRPEQLARLSIGLTRAVLKGAGEASKPEWSEKVTRQADFQASVPAGRPMLRFRPVVGHRGHVPLPGDLAMIRFRIDAETDGRHTRLWQEDIPPFCSPWRTGDPAFLSTTAWWGERVISIADLAGQDVTFHFTAEHLDGRGHPQLTIGFHGVAVMTSGR